MNTFPLKEQWEIILLLSKNDFKNRYHGSFLGFIWVLLKPLFIFLTLNFVFSYLFKSTVENYSLELLVGLILWGSFAEGTTNAMMSLLQKAHILTKISIPKYSYLLSSVLSTFYSFLVNLLIIIVFFIWNRVFPPIEHILLLIPLLLCIGLISLSFGALTSVLFLRLRDLNQIWEVLLNAAFYACPIVYPLSMLPPNIQIFTYMNPMTYIITQAKGLLLSQSSLILSHYLLFIGGIVLLSSISMFVFISTSQKAAEYV